ELRSYITLLQENENVEKIKINSAFIKLIIKVLEEYPIFNSIERDSKIIIYKKYNIGMAVMSGGYLKVPVIKDAGSKNLSEINAEIIKIIEKAKNNELKEENFRDGTFTFSNAGINEVDIVTPIINHPQKAIIAVSRIAVKPSIYNGEIRPRVMTNLCLTYDHRIIDGANAGLFISRFKEIIQSGKLIGEILS
ncbi:MAG: 2-oxo acid dehydrogenase subunit E2, partial [Thiobacillus sp.]